MNSLKILIVRKVRKGNVAFFSQLENLFEQENIAYTDSINEAMKYIVKNSPDIIFIEHGDNNINSSIDSVDAIKNIREIIKYTTPIIIFTNHGNEEIAVNAMLAGANDYFVTERIQFESVEARIKEVISSYLYTEKIKADLIKYKSMSLLDELTGLYNRHGLKKLLSKELSHSKRHKIPLTCLYLDLDDFKEINDTQGHDIGDEILVETSKRLQYCLREDDILSRVGGDEFVIICIGLSDKTKIISLSHKIIKTIQRAHQTPNGDAFISVSIGISTSDDLSTIKNLINCADYALRKSKTDKGIFTFFE